MSSLGPTTRIPDLCELVAVDQSAFRWQLLDPMSLLGVDMRFLVFQLLRALGVRDAHLTKLAAPEVVGDGYASVVPGRCCQATRERPAP